MSEGDVLFIPGFMDTPETSWWRIIHEQFEDSSYRPHFVDGIDQYQTMQLKTPALGRIVIEYVDENDLDVSGFIGHSKGAIVARYLTEYEDLYQLLEPDWSIGIAAPNNGASLAEVPGFLDGTECISEGECIEEINQKGPNPEVDYLNIRSEDDTWSKLHESEPPNEEYAELWEDIVISREYSDVQDHLIDGFQSLMALDINEMTDDLAQAGSHFTEHHMGMFYEEELYEEIADFTGIEQEDSPNYFDIGDPLGLVNAVSGLPGAMISSDQKIREAKANL